MLLRFRLLMQFHLLVNGVLRWRPTRSSLSCLDDTNQVVHRIVQRDIVQSKVPLGYYG